MFWTTKIQEATPILATGDEITAIKEIDDLLDDVDEKTPPDTGKNLPNDDDVCNESTNSNDVPQKLRRQG